MAHNTTRPTFYWTMLFGPTLRLMSDPETPGHLTNNCSPYTYPCYSVNEGNHTHTGLTTTPGVDHSLKYFNFLS